MQQQRIQPKFYPGARVIVSGESQPLIVHEIQRLPHSETPVYRCVPEFGRVGATYFEDEMALTPEQPRTIRRH